MKLFAGYDPPYVPGPDESQRQLQRQARVAVYALAVEGIPGWIVDRSVTDFIQGRVERKRRDILPTAEQIAAHCRDILNDEANRQARLREQAEQVREAKEFTRKQAFLSSPEGERHQRERAARAAQILAQAGLKSME
ncbi:hypothetical protein QBK99_11110 [Corticibacterium sp. UT-5YL-CI-8]|nr:hypothetical protein [Tianweitania sp. UT-5YL-CI-8]